MTSDPVIAWLLATDPAIAWQVQRDLLDASEDVWRPLRSRVEHEGWGARLLAHQDSDGQWAGGAFFPHDFSRELWEAEGQPWTATTYALTDLREWGLDPTSETARRTADLVGRNSRWDHDGQSYWAGEVEECINGRTLADGAYFGADVTGIADRLLTEQQPDGGWNCERAEGSTRGSFHSTINVLEGLLEFEKATGRADVASARHTGEEFLLSRSLFRRLTAGTMTCSAAWITCAPPDSTTPPARTRASARRWTGSAARPRTTAGGRWNPAPAAGFGSMSTTASVCRPPGSPSAPDACCGGLTTLEELAHDGHQLGDAPGHAGSLRGLR